MKEVIISFSVCESFIKCLKPSQNEEKHLSRGFYLAYTKSGILFKEVDKKLNIYKRPKGISVKPVLIYSGEIDKDVMEVYQEYFYKIISFEALLD